MWKKESDKTAQIWPQQVNKDKTTYKAFNEVVFVQIIICLLIVGTILLCRFILPSAYETICVEYHQLITSGNDFSSATELIRFANSSIDNIRAFVDDISNGSQNGAGGAYKINGNQVPVGASVLEYNINEKMILPVEGTITSTFGFRKNPIDGNNDFHMGIDLAADEGTIIKSALSGQVIKIGYTVLRGNYIIIRHKNGLCTLYQHLLYSYKRAGENTYKGEPIAAVGSTGYVTGPHLHFEVILNGIRMNPQYALDI